MTDCPRLRAQIEAFCPYNEQETADRLQMLQDIDTYPVLLIAPALMISIMILVFNLFGDGLRDAFDPKLKS